MLAVVGSRKPTAYGRQVVNQLIAGLRGTNTTIISGLALGIDSLAHRAALDNNLPTIAVLPSGLDKIYPASHRHLAQEITAKGTLISEYPAGTTAAKYHFPARNRIIAALAQAVLVVEAAERSGSLITAEHALDIGVGVLAVPGPVTSPLSAGTNHLIQIGAGMINSVDDLLLELGIEAGQRQSPRGQNRQEQLILDVLHTGPQSVHQLQVETAIDVRELSQILTSLEVTGSVTALSGNVWSLR